MTETVNQTERFRGPNTGIVATVFVALFFGSLLPVTVAGGRPYFPGPTASAAEMVDFFSHRQGGTLLCSFLQFGAAIPLGIFTTTVVARLKYLRVRAAGIQIALFGGIATAIALIISSCFLWGTTYPGIPENTDLLHAIYGISFGIGGPGYSVPFGLLAAGVTIPAAFYKLMPKWVVVLGLIVAAFGLLSWFEILSVKLLLLIPLTRFSGFVWIIAAGFTLAKRKQEIAA